MDAASEHACSHLCLRNACAAFPQPLTQAQIDAELQRRRPASELRDERIRRDYGVLERVFCKHTQAPEFWAYEREAIEAIRTRQVNINAHIDYHYAGEPRRASPLFAALDHCNRNVARALLDAPDLDLSEGYTLLHLAIDMQIIDFLLELLARGVRPTTCAQARACGVATLTYAASQYFIGNAAQVLHEIVRCTDTSDDGMHVDYRNACTQCTRIASCTLCAPTPTQPGCATALYMACKYRHMDNARALLELGADPNERVHGHLPSEFFCADLILRMRTRTILPTDPEAAVIVEMRALLALMAEGKQQPKK